MKDLTAPRIDREIMDGWEFAWNDGNSKNFQPVRLPHDWAINRPFDKTMEEGASQGYRNRYGIGWYRKMLMLEEKREGIRCFLDFGGIYEDSTVWVNGKEAGGHKYGYSSFRLDVTELVREGENRIEVRVDNTGTPSDRWYSGAGIYRTVRWIETEEVHLDEKEVIIHTGVEGKNGRVTVYTGLPGRTVRAGLRDGEQEWQAQTDDGGMEILVPEAKLWSAEEPNLYELTLSLMDGEREADRLSFRVGIREISMAPGKGMFVNGEHVLLKGVCLHQDAGCLGTAVRKEIFRQRLLSLKEMGCNAIRAAHHTFCPEFLDLCDELGFYVYEECFDKWHGGLYGRYFETEWQKDVEAMVKRDRNRPCIFIWGVGNEVENQGQKGMLDTLEMLTAYVKGLDASRPVTYAMNPHFKRESGEDVSKIKDIQQFVDEVSDTEIYDNAERMERIAGIAGYVDVISCNYQEQWYPMIHERIPDKLILGTEVYQYFQGHPDQMQNFTDENPSLVPEKLPYVIGGMIWTGIDYLGESMGYPSKGWSGAPIRTNGEKKPGYYILQSYWSKKTMVHFSVMDYSLSDENVKEHWDMPLLADHWHFPQFRKTVIPYVIASNCEEVRLYLNEKRIYVPKPSACANRLISGFLPWQPGTVTVIGLNGGKEECRYQITTPGPAVKLAFDQEQLFLPPENGYEILLTVRAQDEDGNPYFRESASVRFRAEGPAEIMAVDNGNLMGNEPYGEECIHMYHGCASVMVRLTGETGRACITADAEGMQSGRTVLVTGFQE